MHRDIKVTGKKYEIDQLKSFSHENVFFKKSIRENKAPFLNKLKVCSIHHPLNTCKTQ